MRIGIIGSGNVGKTLGRGWSMVGHDVMVGSRSPDREDLTAWANEADVALGDLAATATHAEVAAVATAWEGTENAIRLAGEENLDGKVLVDATNPLRFTDRLELTIGHTDSAGEQVQRWVPGARVVKAFNTVGFDLMDHPDLVGGPPTMFIAGDDDEARSVVASLTEQLGWGIHDCGDLRAARLTEPLAVLWIEHSMRSGSRDHAFKLL